MRSADGLRNDAIAGVLGAINYVTLIVPAFIFIGTSLVAGRVHRLANQRAQQGRRLQTPPLDPTAPINSPLDVDPATWGVRGDG